MTLDDFISSILTNDLVFEYAGTSYYICPSVKAGIYTFEAGEADVYPVIYNDVDDLLDNFLIAGAKLRSVLEDIVPD